MTPFDKAKRKSLTANQKAQLFSKANGCCQSCGVKLRSGSKWAAFDHIEALMNQGDNDISNYQILCQNCHGAKTSADFTERKRNRRKYTKTNVPREPSRTWGGSRKFNGDIVDQFGRVIGRWKC